jgi:hypothetical protein
MTNFFQTLASRGFRDLSGLTISGVVPVKQALINELLADFLSGSLTSGQPRQDATERSFDPRELLQLVKKLEVRIESGAITVEFEVRA